MNKEYAIKYIKDNLWYCVLAVYIDGKINSKKSLFVSARDKRVIDEIRLLDDGKNKRFKTVEDLYSWVYKRRGCDRRDNRKVNYSPESRKKYHRDNQELAEEVINICKNFGVAPYKVRSFYKLPIRYRQHVLSRTR